MKLWENSNGTVVEFFDDTEMIWVNDYKAYVHINDTQEIYGESDDFDYWYELDTNDISSYAKWCKANNKDAKFIGYLNEYTNKVYER